MQMLQEIQVATSIQVRILRLEAQQAHHTSYLQVYVFEFANFDWISLKFVRQKMANLNWFQSKFANSKT